MWLYKWQGHVFVGFATKMKVLSEPLSWELNPHKSRAFKIFLSWEMLSTQIKIGRLIFIIIILFQQLQKGICMQCHEFNTFGSVLQLPLFFCNHCLIFANLSRSDSLCFCLAVDWLILSVYISSEYPRAEGFCFWFFFLQYPTALQVIKCSFQVCACQSNCKTEGMRPDYLGYR